MKLLFDFFPVLLFFITFKAYDDPKQGILAATAVIIVATGIQVAVTWFKQRRVEKIHVVTLALLVGMGGITLLLQDEIYIKWKATVFYWLLAVAFLGSQFAKSRAVAMHGAHLGAVADQALVGQQSFDRLVAHRPHATWLEALERRLEGRPLAVDQAVL